MRKKFLLPCCVLLITLLISGCSKQSESNNSKATQPETNKQIETAAQTKPEIKTEAETEPETTQSANKSYNDGTISCEYDSSILKITTFEPSDEIPYFVIIGKTSDNPKEASDGDCIQINTMPFRDCEMLFKNYPAAFTQTLFNNIFGVPESAMPTLTGNQKDGTYEYDLETQDFTYKAKVVKAVDDLVTFAFYKTANDLQAEIKSNFNDCYNSLTFLDQKENETEANKPSKITSGDLYDSITSIYPDVILYDMRDGTLSISIYMSGGSVDSNSVAFFYLTNEILNNCNIEKEYSSVSVDMMAEDKLTAMLTLLSYKSATSYKSDFIVLEDSYKEAMEKVYNEGFLAHDIGAVFDSELESLAYKYGIKH